MFLPSARVGSLRPTAVNRVLDEVRRAQAAGRDVVSLMRGQPDTPTPPHIVVAAEKALRAGRTGYADNQGEPALRAAVAEKLRRDNGLDYDPAREILITDGATCGLAAALAVLLEPGDDVLLPDPIYDAYASPVALFGGRPVPVPATIRSGRFCLDADALNAACTPRSKVLLLNHPWNPVGTVFTADELRALTTVAIERRLTLVSDEIYELLVYDGLSFVSPAALGPDVRERTILVNSLSKTYAMTGWRVGYCAAAAEIVRAMLLVLQQWSRGPATFVQDAAAAALSGDQSCVRALRDEYQARRDRVCQQLAGIPGARPLVPEGGLFVMVDLRDEQPPVDAAQDRADGLGGARQTRDSDAVRKLLLDRHGVVVLHGGAYGPSGEGTLRVSFAAGGTTLERGLERLRAGLLELGEWSPCRDDDIEPRP